MGKALYRKYRSKKLSEIVGQEHVTTALDNALKSGRIGHAYLFTGPRGTGKTSVARILAHEVNNLPYDEDANHLDIIEIDAASNRRIDEIRALRERVHNAPTSAKYKVYIIDEVHMLTKEAFNALLKTLEEPPDHVIFVLATTEVHKLPDTIISRTQRYSFKPAEKTEAARHLRSIAKQEGLSISDEALQLIAEHGRGSFRDSISLLDQVSNMSDTIEIDHVRRSLGIAPAASIEELVRILSDGNAQQMVTLLRELHQQGYQAPQLARQLSAKLRTSLLNQSTDIDPVIATDMLAKLIDIPAAHDPQALLEIRLLEPVLGRTTARQVVPSANATETSPVKKPAATQEPIKQHKQPSTVKQAEESEAPVSTKEKEEPTEQTFDSSLPMDENTWQQILHNLKQQHNTLYGIARMAVPLFDDGKLTLSFSFPFHQKRMNESRNKQKLTDIVKTELGHDIEIICIVDKGSTPAPQTPRKGSESVTDNPVDTISNIFGGAEVLE